MRESDVIFEPADDRLDRKHVLIIDDDVSVLKTLRYHLQDTYRVSVVNSGKVALDFLQKHKPDLILLDYLMPTYNGAAVLKTIQGSEDTKDIPVLFLTGQSDMSTVTECLALNPAGYIVKPISKEALLGKLESVL
ncbi:MAG: response regulator [Lachnospiraceae bacterium]|jgi:CheY-like chemotaxis protein|nr:response regulator [Lachnospiraceae bacterium]